MNRYLFEQMMQRMGSQNMLPPPADYAPGGSMFPALAQKKVGGDATKPTTMLGKVTETFIPNTRAAFAGKGGANGG